MHTGGHVPWPRSLRLWSWCTCVLNAGHLGSRRRIRGVAHSQAPFAPAAPPSPAHSADTRAGTQVSGAGAGDGNPQSFPSESPRLCLGALEQGFPDQEAEWTLSPRSPQEKEPGLQTTHSVAQRGTYRQQWPPSSFSHPFLLAVGGGPLGCATQHAGS